MKVCVNVVPISFQRRLKASEEAEYMEILNKAKTKAGNNGYSMLIIPSASLPQNRQANIGAGNILDKEGIKFFDFVKKYWGINTVQMLPNGVFRDFPQGQYRPYSGSSFDLGNQVINLELLTKDEYGKILSTEDFKQVVETNSKKQINFENVLNPDSKTEEALRKAYKNLIKSDSPLLQEMEKYNLKNAERLNPKAVYNILAKKYGTFDTRCLPKFETINIEEILEKNPEDAGFYKFKQFIAEKHLDAARNELNKKGIKLSGDFLLGFSHDEVWANPKAFVENTTVGWGLPALNLDSTEGQKLLREKAEFFGRHYDCMRVDAAWAYVVQPHIKDGKTIVRKQYGSKILDVIDEGFKKSRGKSFDSADIMYELIFNPEEIPELMGVEISPVAKDRVKIYTSYNLTEDWSSAEAFKKRGWKDESYILGTTNHDDYPLRVEYQNLAKRNKQIKILSKILKIPEEKISSFSGYMQAKFAEPMRAKHNMMFFTEALNLTERYKGNKNHVDDYRLRVPASYQDDYFKSLERGEGYNPMDALEKAFVSKGLDKSEPELYKKVVKYKKILQQKEGGNKSKPVYISIAAVLALAGIVMIMRGGGEASAPEKKDYFASK